jgi:hypothetical protein
MITPTVTIDASGLNRGLALAALYTRKTPARACNYAALEVAFETQKTTPMVTVPEIDSQLSVIKVEVIGKRGKPLKRKWFTGTKTARNPEVPLAVLIVQARANPNSRYNLEFTNSRYARPSPFKGVSRAAGRMAMALAVHEMIALRHKSIAFLRAGWSPVIKTLKQARRGSIVNTGIEALTPSNDTLGAAIPAKEGDVRATCIIENQVGYKGQNQVSFDKALQLYGAPALQRALDGQGEKEMQYYLDKSYQSELVQPFNAMNK